MGHPPLCRTPAEAWQAARRHLDALEARHGLVGDQSLDLGPPLYADMLQWCRANTAADKRRCLICEIATDHPGAAEDRAGWWEPASVSDFLAPIWVCWEHEAYAWDLTLTPAPPTLPGIDGPAWIETWRREIWFAVHVNPYPPPPEIRPHVTARVKAAA